MATPSICYGSNQPPDRIPGVCGVPPHSDCTEWAWWPQDRLCALKADQTGEFSSTPLVPAGRQLKLNFHTFRAGEIKVGIEGVDGRSAADCDPMHGDHSGHVVTWHGQSNPGLANDEPVSLHFTRRCAELFAVE